MHPVILDYVGKCLNICSCGKVFESEIMHQHSGSCDADPGNAVFMDNGETIAHWWKVLSSKIRVCLFLLDHLQGRVCRET